VYLDFFIVKHLLFYYENILLLNHTIFRGDYHAGVHKERVLTRDTDIKGLRLPSWDEVVSREYESWEEVLVKIDTSKLTIDDAAKYIIESLEGAGNE